MSSDLYHLGPRKAHLMSRRGLREALVVGLHLRLELLDANELRWVQLLAKHTLQCTLRTRAGCEWRACAAFCRQLHGLFGAWVKGVSAYPRTTGLGMCAHKQARQHT